jgi:hypothetical protein
VFEVANRSGKTGPRISSKRGYFLFLGPVNPTTLDECLSALSGRFSRAWLAFGLYNAVIYSVSADEAGKIAAWAARSGIRCERWSLNRNLIRSTKPCHGHNARPQALLDCLANFGFSSPVELRDAAEEYCALLATAGCRSAEVASDLCAELEQANKIILQSAKRLATEKGDGRGLAAIALLVDANAALSRYTSQMYSGTSPIFETECHFWTHSLLGTGVANLALLRIRRFVTSTLGEARIPEQLSLMREVIDPDIIRNVLEDGPIWNGPWLHKLPDILNRKPLLPTIAPLAPLITYLSGRDGYHTTQSSLSAPLNVLSSCSSLRWSLLTITHEMSHRVIDGALGYILPNPLSQEELSTAAALLNNAPPRNLLECLEFKILNTMAELNAVLRLVEVSDTVTERNIVDLTGTRREEIEELMVHVFDFIYFYGSDPALYVPAIWRSWDAIPSLHRRLPNYVLRTLCAVLSKFWNSNRPTQNTVAAVMAGMEQVARRDKDNAYIRHSLEYLKDEKEALQKQLWSMRSLVGIVRTFFQSPAVLQKVRGQSAKADAFRGFLFDGSRIENPLRFLEDHTSTKTSDLKSFWMLTRLAFDTVDPGPFRVGDVDP